MESHLHLITSDIIKLNITHSNLTAVFPEIKFSSEVNTNLLFTIILSYILYFFHFMMFLI